jgi:hypothetical protein
MFGAMAAFAENLQILRRVGTACCPVMQMVRVEACEAAAATAAAVPGDHIGSHVPPLTG